MNAIINPYTPLWLIDTYNVQIILVNIFYPHNQAIMGFHENFRRVIISLCD